MADILRDSRWQAGLIGWLPVGGGVLAVAVLGGLQPRIDEYRFQAR